MEKIKFMFDDGEQSVEFFVLEETKINGVSYILVDDDVELGAVSKVFGELLEDIEIEM